MRIGILIVLLFFGGHLIQAQYTDQINSNRPGESIGAFSVGTRVIQFEAGTEYRSYKHVGYNNSKMDGSLGFFSLRWGFLKEELELTYEGTYLMGELNSRIVAPNPTYKQQGFLRNFIGVKYLVYDPFKKQQETNVYSWDANNKFKIRDLIPAVSLTLGANFNIDGDENPYPYGDVFDLIHRPIFFQNIFGRGIKESFVSYRGTVATQSHFLGTWVFVTNFSYNRIATDYPEISYILTLTHTFNPVWSVYIENQGFSSDVYTDQIFRTGAAYLLTDDIQIEGTIGVNTKDTPSLFSINAGISYRLDFHRDKEKAIKDSKDVEKALKKERKALEKQAKKAGKSQRKARRRARKN
jgi:hypothetical protein